MGTRCRSNVTVTSPDDGKGAAAVPLTLNTTAAEVTPPAGRQTVVPEVMSASALAKSKDSGPVSNSVRRSAPPPDVAAWVVCLASFREVLLVRPLPTLPERGRRGRRGCGS